MRLRSIFLCAAVLLAVCPAMAGNVAVSEDGKVVWRSTKCQAPAVPPGLGNNPETPANELNARVAEYNKYVPVVETYMNCMSGEAQKDAAATSQAVIDAAQKVIADEQAKLKALAPVAPPGK
ncbi:MAG: hypothetical protein AB7H77_11665 [Bdellovibrionales bacterium]